MPTKVKTTLQDKLSLALATLASLLSAAAVMACSVNDNRGPASTAPKGSRTYKLDPEAAAIRVSVYGVLMGTPDAVKFDLLMNSLKANGEFATLIQEATGIEGGFTMCAEFATNADQAAIYELLRSIETDPKDTHFSATSVTGCQSQNP